MRVFLYTRRRSVIGERRTNQSSSYASFFSQGLGKQKFRGIALLANEPLAYIKLWEGEMEEETKEILVNTKMFSKNQIKS